MPALLPARLGACRACPSRLPTASRRTAAASLRRPLAVQAAATEPPRPEGPTSAGPSTSGAEDAEAITRKFGLEAGLWKVFTAKDGGEGGAAAGGESKGTQAKDLLKRYGSAYLITSISLSAVSFGLCYALVSAGVDVAALLAQIGFETSGSAETAGTAAIAYAAHKALSPVRFPPTVALTPMVAQLMGKTASEEGK